MDEHEDLEHLLRQGLRPRQTPAGFSARLMARLPETSPVPSFQKKRTFWVPAAALGNSDSAAGGCGRQLLAAPTAGAHRRRARTRTTLLALRMSAATLNDVQHKVLRSTTGDSE
jgi:hypothetical protein